MQNILNLISFLCSIDLDNTKAGIIVSCVLGGVIVFCAFCLIFKKLLLNRKYKEDELFVKEYRKKLEEKERKEQEDKKNGLIGEEF